MSSSEILAAFERIDTHCKARGWHHRLPGLRKHYARVQGGEDLAEFAQQLLETMRLPPFEAALPVRPKDWRCCPKPHGSAAAHTKLVIEDTFRFQCTECSREWLVVDE